MENKLPVTQCQYCGSRDIGEGETRWHSFNENLDHPETDQNFEKYVNSRMEDGKIRILFRDLVKGDTYEHTNS